MTVTSGDLGMLRLLFGDHAEEMADLLRRVETRPPGRWVQVHPTPDNLSET